MESYRHVLPLVNTPHVPAQRLHPLEGFTTIITDELFPLGVDRLVSVQRARGDEGLPADVTSVRPLPGVCPDVSREVGAVTEALLADGAAVGLLFALLAVVVVVGVEEQAGVRQAALQAGRRRDEVFDVGLEALELLHVVTGPEVPVALQVLLLLHLRGLRVLLLHAVAAPILLTRLGLGRLR